MTQNALSDNQSTGIGLFGLGVVGSADFLSLVRDGKVIAKLPPEELEERLVEELAKFK